jgi:hypothetical protein
MACTEKIYLSSVYLKYLEACLRSYIYNIYKNGAST